MSQLFWDSERIRLFLFPQHAGRHLGIGYGVSETLVRELARASRGAAEFICPDERIEDKVLRQFARVGTRCLTDLRINWNGLEVRQSPVEIPPIFSGDSITVYGLIENGASYGPIILSGSNGDHKVSWSAPVANKGETDTIPTLWARSYIREIECGKIYNSGSQQTNRKESINVKRLLEIALRYNLISSQTSMVAVDIRRESIRAMEPVEYRRVPIQLTRDWQGSAGKVKAFLACDVDPPTTRRITRVQSVLRAPTPIEVAERLGLRGRSLNQVSEKANYSENAWILDLLQTQTAAGNFTDFELLAKLLPKSIDELKSLAEQIEQIEDAAKESALITALTLLLFRTRARDSKKLWKRAADKAERWLKKNAKPATLHGEPLRDALSTLMASNVDYEAVSHPG